MKNPKIKVRIVHSKSTSAWNIINAKLGGKHKIAIVPYLESEDPEVSSSLKQEAYEHASYIATCFNTSDFICEQKLRLN